MAHRHDDEDIFDILRDTGRDALRPYVTAPRHPSRPGHPVLDIYQEELTVTYNGPETQQTKIRPYIRLSVSDVLKRLLKQYVEGGYKDRVSVQSVSPPRQPIQAGEPFDITVTMHAIEDAINPALDDLVASPPNYLTLERKYQQDVQQPDKTQHVG